MPKRSETNLEGVPSQKGFFGAVNRRLHLRISSKITLIFSGVFFVFFAVILTVMFVVADKNVYDSQHARMESALIQAKKYAQSPEKLEVYHSVLRDSGISLDGAPSAGPVVSKTFSRARHVLSLVEIYESSGARTTCALTSDVSDQINSLWVLKISLICCLAVSMLCFIVFGKLCADGVTRPIRNMTLIATGNERNALGTRLRLTTHDELRDLAVAVNQMLDNLQGMYETQERFVSDASHELRTPIAIIKGYANMLTRWGAQDEAILKESIDAIADEIDSMQQLINNLLFLSRSDRNTLSVTFQNFSLREMLDDILKETEMVDQNHIYLRARMEDVDFFGERDMIKQLLRIILDNAIKYTNQGGTITLSCYQEEHIAVVKIIDQGIGIAPRDLARIFERFYRADKARSREGGSGLGMPLAKKIADFHKGEIVIESKPGDGTAVSILLPINNPINN